MSVGFYSKERVGVTVARGGVRCQQDYDKTNSLKAANFSLSWCNYVTHLNPQGHYSD